MLFECLYFCCVDDGYGDAEEGEEFYEEEEQPLSAAQLLGTRGLITFFYMACLEFKN